MIQPFLDGIHQGEYSLFFFANKYGHSIIKVPASEDFRSQEEYGSKIEEIVPEVELLELANTIIEKNLDKDFLYCRLDFIKHRGEYYLIELECIEPNLYFSKSVNAANNFVTALITRMN